MRANVSVSSATASAFLPGELVTGIPRSVAAATSTLTGPPRAQQTSRSDAASRTSAVIGAPCTTTMSCPATAATMFAGAPAYSRISRSEAVCGGGAEASSICSSVTDTASPSFARAPAKALTGMKGSPTARTRTCLAASLRTPQYAPERTARAGGNTDEVEQSLMDWPSALLRSIDPRADVGKRSRHFRLPVPGAARD